MLNSSQKYSKEKKEQRALQIDILSNTKETVDDDQTPTTGQPGISTLLASPKGTSDLQVPPEMG